MPFPYNLILGRDTALPSPLYHSGVTGIEISCFLARVVQSLLSGQPIGEVAERLNAVVSKTTLGATLTWVQIPPSPLKFQIKSIPVAPE